jgi:hypothetical protein
MKNRFVTMATLLGVAFLIAHATIIFAQDVNVDYDHHANFERYHTYSWKMVKTPNTIWDQRVCKTP